MDGVHDLGGREGFGPIVDKADERPFHDDWEMRAFGIKQSAAGGRHWTIDWFRHSRELTDPVDYLTRPYFDQWLTTLAAQMIDEGYLTLDEIRAGAPASVVKPAVPRFVLGATVRCRLDGHSGHTRLPAYVRGRAGIIHAQHAGHVLPDASAHGEERGEHLYTVSFASSDLWPEAKGSGDRVFVDLWESYLEAA